MVYKVAQLCHENLQINLPTHFKVKDPLQDKSATFKNLATYVARSTIFQLNQTFHGSW